MPRYNESKVNKIMYILRGISGSGKSTFANTFNNPIEHVVCSADNYFTDRNTGVYNFNPSKLPAAHAACFRDAVEACQSDEIRIVIIDNTSTTVAEIAPYHALGVAYGFKVQIITITCPPEICASRNTHGVPLATCQRMAARLEAETPIFPPWWAHTYKY